MYRMEGNERGEWDNCNSIINETYFLKNILFIFRERGREKERERNISVWLPLEHPLLGTWHVS